ncbi:hypothetical protein FRC18_010945 [Serendipita sp. 400]|nr:hypothetical protein FRC18_010945 [Serendipita sp. 400]
MPPRSAPKSKGGITSGKSAQKRKRSSEESRGVTMERKMQELVEAELAAHESTFEAYRAAIDQCSQKIKLYKDAKESWKKKKMSKNATACNKKLQQYSKILEENESDMVKLREAIEATARAQFLEGMANNDNEGAGSDSELESERENSSEESEEEDARPKKKKKTVEVFASEMDSDSELRIGLPPKLIEAARKGATPIPFSFLADIFVNRSDANQLALRGGTLQHPVYEANDSKLSKEESMSAYHRHLALCKAEWGEERAKHWRTFWQARYFGKRIDSEVEWPRLREFAIYTNNCCPWAPVNGRVMLPDPNAAGILRAAEAQAIRATHHELLAKIQSKAEKSEVASASNPPRQFFRDARPGTGEKQRPTDRRTPCYVCGGPHASRTCQATVQINGESLMVKRNEKQDWILIDGRSFCWPFNGKGCQTPNCKNGAHVCSRCTDRNHGAANCLRKAN